MSRTQQSINKEKGERLERKVLDKISSSCAFAARVSETSGGHSTPDLVCVQDTKKGLKPKVRLIEVKYNGYVQRKQRDELVDIAERSPANVAIEVHNRISPRKEEKTTVRRAGDIETTREPWSPEKTREMLEDEFSTKRFDIKEWRSNN